VSNTTLTDAAAINAACILANSTDSTNTTSAGAAAATGAGKKGKGKGKGKKGKGKAAEAAQAGCTALNGTAIDGEAAAAQDLHNGTAAAGSHKTGKAKGAAEGEGAAKGKGAGKAKGQATNSADPAAAAATATVGYSPLHYDYLKAKFSNRLRQKRREERLPNLRQRKKLMSYILKLLPRIPKRERSLLR
jgi:hypothetical protein